jgi:FkbM family methyltransferase
VLGNRPWGLVARNVLRRENYAAMWRMRRVAVQPRTTAWRYLTGRGEYPWRCPVHTPLGVVAPRTYSHDDIVTVTEIFCRLDYDAPADVRVVVDLGSNIGVSGLYFVTRNPQVRCHLYEPVPRNVARLRENLAGYEDRYRLTQAAVWDRDGTVEFGVEPTGRYGGIGVAANETIEVPCLDVNRVLDRVLEEAPAIDVLKLDTEGAELATVAAIRGDLLARIRVIYLETMDRPSLHADRFDAAFSCDTLRLANRALQRGRA